jgi:hypothetical protein
MCKCICVPKNSGNNPKCDTCHPERPKGKGHDRRKHDEIKARRGRETRTGVILAQHEPIEDQPVGDPT